MSTEAMRRNRCYHTTLRSRLHNRAKDFVGTAKIDLADRIDAANDTESESSAAHALMDLQQESTCTLSDLVRSNGNKTSQAVKAIIRHANHNFIKFEKDADKSPHDTRCTMKKAGLDAALTLVKLSGQSRAESKAGLTLLCLRRDSKPVVHERHSGNWLAQLALRKKRSNEQWLALKKFRHQFPAVLRTSVRKTERTSMKADIYLRR